MRILITLIAVVLVVAVGVWAIGKNVGAPSAQQAEVVSSDNNDLPTFDTPDLFKTEEEKTAQPVESVSRGASTSAAAPLSPTEAEIQRLEDERRLLEAQQKLEEQKAESMPPILPETMPRPVTEF